MAETVLTEVSTLGDLLLRATVAEPNRQALVLPEAGVTYEQLWRGASAVAAALIANGLTHGAHVALLVPNSIEYAEALFGVALAGCVAVPLNARHKASELAFIIRNAEAAAIITSSDQQDPLDFPALLADALPDPAVDTPEMKLFALIRGTTVGRFVGRSEFLAQGFKVDAARLELARRRVRVRDPAIIIYTSGTTANPKGCVLSHEALTRGPVERARHRLHTPDCDVTWGAGPLFHIGSLAPFIGSVGVAGTYLTDSYFDPGRALALMAREGVTLAWPWFSAIVQGLIDHPDFKSETFARLRYLFLIAPATLVERTQQVFPQAEILQACGMTETAGIFALSDPDEDQTSRSNTQGKPAPGVDIRIVDPESGRDLPDGEMGEILVRGYNVLDEYWRAPEKTAEAILPGHWLRTGDLYTRLPNGSLMFGGRCKDMLKVGGENVAAIEVESFLCTHPAVKIAEVVGRPDARLDEVPVAFVELREGALLDEQDLIAFCQGQIARYKIPRAIIMMKADDWPMSATKVDKRALRDMLRP